MMKAAPLVLPILGLILTLFTSCSSTGKLVSVIVEDKNGNTELIYERSELPENLVKEVRFFPNGDTLSVTPMMKGEVHGVVLTYAEGNLLVEQVTFNAGVQDGVFKRFDKEGVLVFQGELKNGMKTGIWTTWYDEVQVQESRLYLNDKPNGKWSYWYIDGFLKREETYENGKLIESVDY